MAYFMFGIWFYHIAQGLYSVQNNQKNSWIVLDVDWLQNYTILGASFISLHKMETYFSFTMKTNYPVK